MARRQTGGRLRAAIFLLVSVGAAVVASLVIYTVINNYKDQLEKAEIPDEVVQIMVAALDLYQGKTIVAEDLTMKELPPDYVPDAVLRHSEQAVGRVPRERILAQEFIREERLADPESGVGLNAIIPRGMRAISINMTGGSAVSGFLNPGNYVDILVTFAATEGVPTETVTLLQAVTLLAVNNRLGASSSEAKDSARPSITLAVTPEQAEKLTHADSQGAVTLTLRNDIDVTHVETHGKRSEDLLGGKTDEKRIEITDWKKATTQQKKDGSLIIIKGPKTSKEKVR